MVASYPQVMQQLSQGNSEKARYSQVTVIHSHGLKHRAGGTASWQGVYNEGAAAYLAAAAAAAALVAAALLTGRAGAPGRQHRLRAGWLH